MTEFLDLERLLRISLNGYLLLESIPTTHRNNPIPGRVRIHHTYNTTISKPELLTYNISKLSAVVSPNHITNIGQRTMPPHIRRGHWRRYRVGSGRSKTQWNWILPTKINF